MQGCVIMTAANNGVERTRHGETPRKGRLVQRKRFRNREEERLEEKRGGGRGMAELRKVRQHADDGNAAASRLVARSAKGEV